MTDVANPTLDGQIQGEVVPEQTPETPPQTDGAGNPLTEKPEPTEEQKRIRNLERKLEKANRNNGRMHGEIERYRALEAELQQRQAPEQHQSQQQQADPREIARQMVEQQRFDEKCNTIVDDGTKRIKGFQDSIRALQDEAPLFNEKGPTPLLRTVIEAADKPADVLDYLGKNLDEAADIADLSPARQAKRIAQIESELSKPKQASAAPTPIKSYRSAAVPQDPKPGQEGYIAWKLKQLNGG